MTDMEEPLGRTVGNALEIRECINILKGKAQSDLYDVILTLGSWMLYIAEEWVGSQEEGKEGYFRAVEADEGKLLEKRRKLAELIDSGRALEKFFELIEGHGGNPEIIATPGLLPVASHIQPLLCKENGYVTKIDAEKVGMASTLLGAGRQRTDDPVDYAVGITLNKKSGVPVKRGDTYAVIHYNDERNLAETIRLMDCAFQVGREPPEPRQVIKKVLL
jgi:thymidine phosphorylase